MPFVHPVHVTAADIDQLGHANNLVYLRWVMEAALAHSAHLGLRQADYLTRGQVWVVRRHEIVYVKPAVLGDVLEVVTRVCSMAAATSERRTRIVRKADRAELARAITDWVFVDHARGRPLRIPDDVRARFSLEPG